MPGELFQEIFKQYFGLLAVLFFVMLFLGFYVIKILGKRAAQAESGADDN